MRNLNKYSLWMACSYIVSLLSIFLPVLKGEAEGESIKVTPFGGAFSFEKTFGLKVDISDVPGLSGILGSLKLVVILLIVFSILGIVLFIMGVGEKEKYGIAVLMGVFGGFIYFFMEVAFHYVKDMADIAKEGVVTIGIGLHLGMLAYIFQIVFPLIYLCFLTGTAGSYQTVDVIDHGQRLKDEIANHIPARDGAVAITRGENAGMEIPLEDGRTVIMGRNSAECNLVVTGAKISRKHCSIKYDASRRMYCLTDYSSNGTYFMNDVRLEPLTAVWVKPGTKFYLGNRDNVFELR